MMNVQIVKKNWQLPASLRDGLIEWWPLSEQSGTRIGSQNQLNMTSNGGVAGAPGVNGELASSFTTANSQYLSRVSEPALQNNGATGFELCLWFNARSLAIGNFMFTKDNFVTDANRQFSLQVFTDGLIYFFVLKTDGTSAIQANTPTTISTNTWYMISAWFDSSDGKGRVCLNNGTIYTSATSISPRNQTGAAPVLMGGRTFDNRFADMWMNRIGYWNRILTPVERTLLYNNGNGLNY